MDRLSRLKPAGRVSHAMATELKDEVDNTNSNTVLNLAVLKRAGNRKGGETNPGPGEVLHRVGLNPSAGSEILANNGY